MKCHGLTRKEIAQNTKINGKNLNTILERSEPTRLPLFDFAGDLFYVHDLYFVVRCYILVVCKLSLVIFCFFSIFQQLLNSPTYECGKTV